MPLNRQAQIDSRPLFYRDGFRRLLTFAFGLIIIIFGFMALIFYQHHTKPAVKYFVTTSDGRLIEIEPG